MGIHQTTLFSSVTIIVLDVNTNCHTQFKACETTQDYYVTIQQNYLEYAYGKHYIIGQQL